MLVSRKESTRAGLRESVLAERELGAWLRLVSKNSSCQDLPRDRGASEADGRRLNFLWF